jgi:dTDP-3-amino-3,4,6-trideoxy-alpha-D-glucose transaminase
MILLNDFKRQWQDVRTAVSAAVERVGASGWYILGREVEEFERALAAFTGARHAVGVANGMDALEIALRACKLEPGTPVLTTPLSAYATTLAIQRAGGRPVFVDVDASGLIDLDQVKEVLHERHEVRFLLPVHLYGHTIDLDRLRELVRDGRATIIEDCAQAIGARWKEQPVGSAGQAAGLSFYPTKNLGALGDGGALLTGDGAVARDAATLRNYGQSSKYKHELAGLNSRLDELQAAILSGSLERLPAWTERRRAIAAQYRAALRSRCVTVPRSPEGSHSVFHLFPVLVDEPTQRDDLSRHLAEAGIQTAIHYPILIPQQKALPPGSFDVLRPLVMAQRFASCELSLPIHPYLDAADVDRVIECVNGWDPRC